MEAAFVRLLEAEVLMVGLSMAVSPVVVSSAAARLVVLSEVAEPEEPFAADSAVLWVDCSASELG